MSWLSTFFRRVYGHSPDDIRAREEEKAEFERRQEEWRRVVRLLGLEVDVMRVRGRHDSHRS